MAAMLSLGITTKAADGDTFTVDNLRYTVLSEAEHSATVSGYVENPTGELVIPSFVSSDYGSEYYVTTIGKSAFYVCSGLTSVIIPNSVTTIEKLAFYRLAA